MPQIFKQLRRRFLQENRLTRYIVYAIGEIILLVVGILIALQINTWNENRKNRELEKSILTEIATDLEQDVVSLENDVRILSNIVSNIDIILAFDPVKNPFNDSLSMTYGSIVWKPISTMKSSGYENLKSSGFHLIRNDSLRRSITELYESNYDFLRRSEDKSFITTWEYFVPKYNEYFIEIHPNETRYLADYIPMNYETLTSDPQFKRLLQYYKTDKNSMLLGLDITLGRIQSVQKLLEKEL